MYKLKKIPHLQTNSCIFVYKTSVERNEWNINNRKWIKIENYANIPFFINPPINVCVCTAVSKLLHIHRETQNRRYTHIFTWNYLAMQNIFMFRNVQLIWARTTTTTPSNAKSIYYDIIRVEHTHMWSLMYTSANMRVQTDINHQSWQPLIKQWQHDVSIGTKL